MALLLILAVGDDPTILSTRCSILRSAGYIVMPASSVSESIDLFRNGDFDLMLLCHSIPVEHRNRLIRAVRSTGSHIPIYAVASASGDFQAGLANGTVSSRPRDLIDELEALTVAHSSTAHAGCH